MKKIAFLFLIYDEINQEKMWKKFFDGVDKNKYSIYIHSKETNDTKVLKYFEDKKLDMTLPTKYGDISLVYVQKLLLKMAMKDKDNFKFIFVSNSCIPVKSFDYIYESLTDGDESYFEIAKQSACFPRCNKVLNFLDKNDIYKASQWCILNQEHAKLCLEDIKIIEYFNGVFAPDEHYFITLCMLYCPENIVNDGKTFANWDESNDPGGCSPKTYNFITSAEFKKLKESAYFFARKFTKECQIYQPLDEF
jgi:hypothetical protein